jgi:hypothetical protein
LVSPDRSLRDPSPVWRLPTGVTMSLWARKLGFAP